MSVTNDMVMSMILNFYYRILFRREIFLLSIKIMNLKRQKVEVFNRIERLGYIIIFKISLQKTLVTY